jgi:hypothetical protein
LSVTVNCHQQAAAYVQADMPYFHANDGKYRLIGLIGQATTNLSGHQELMTSSPNMGFIDLGWRTSNFVFQSPRSP